MELNKWLSNVLAEGVTTADALSVNQLRGLAAALEAEIVRREISGKREALEELKKLAKSRGYSLEELTGQTGAAKEREKSAVRIKYRNPKMMSQTWTGRGKKPHWVTNWLSEGGSLEDLLVS